jgi:membrane protease YdiL (CAAX protease family)
MRLWHAMPRAGGSAGQPPIPGPAAERRGARLEALLVLLYFTIWFGSLFLTLEGELAHWATLVALPSALLLAVRAARGGDASLRGVLASVGLRPGRLGQGLLLAVAVGAAISALQLLVSRGRWEILELLGSPAALWVLPAAFGLLLLTAATTEEYFFRGVLQERLARWWGSEAGAIVVASVLFGLYHLPYAYLKASWPSHGDLGAALAAALAQGGIAGLILGWVYVRSGKNLLAPVVAHALINLLPAARWVAAVST